ncbi:tubulin cofactor B [Trichodelitschia bisporula]|uniref:Tubulin cofactor B n=1 Tax=Trichodelitschia bisporula TaxID=703511 RepID=A0A6G1HQA2_9PEZI|nr:tubulin cofactor B [Trichodelitschia bisporula]
MADIPLLIASANASAERRVTPSWTISHFKTRLEPVTGIPPGCQRLVLRGATGAADVPIEAADEDAVTLERWALAPYAEIYVNDTRPPGARPDFTDVSRVEKFELAPEAYEARTDSVLAWKKKAQLGRFDPNAPSIEAQKVANVEREIEERGIKLGARVRMLPDSDRAPWLGVRLDEPVGRNDGSAGGVKYFDAGGPKGGVFVRPERVEVGDFGVLGLDEGDEELEEM